MTRMGAALAALLMAALAGCGGTSPGGSTSGSLEKRTFLSTSLRPESLLPGTRIWLSFPEKGKIAAQAGCNHLFGNLAIDGDKLVVSEMGGTDMGCDQGRMTQDEWLSKFLTSKPTWKLNGNELVLTSGETELKLLDRVVANPDRQLVGQAWIVDSLLDGEAASSVPAGVQAELTFSADGKVTGNTGCNRLTGDYTVAGDKITFGPLATTKMMCTTEAGQVETHVTGTLDGEVSWRIEADRLVLTHSSGRGLQLHAGG